jgi:hypothetical protein
VPQVGRDAAAEDLRDAASHAGTNAMILKIFSREEISKKLSLLIKANQVYVKPLCYVRPLLSFSRKKADKTFWISF